jgi:hypothetical protein
MSSARIFGSRLARRRIPFLLMTAALGAFETATSLATEAIWAMAPGQGSEPGQGLWGSAEQARENKKTLNGTLCFISRAMPRQCQRRRPGWRKRHRTCRATRPVPDPVRISTSRSWLKLNVRAV